MHRRFIPFLELETREKSGRTNMAPSLACLPSSKKEPCIAPTSMLLALSRIHVCPQCWMRLPLVLRSRPSKRFRLRITDLRIHCRGVHADLRCFNTIFSKRKNALGRTDFDRCVRTCDPTSAIEFPFPWKMSQRQMGKTFFRSRENHDDRRFIVRQTGCHPRTRHTCTVFPESITPSAGSRFRTGIPGIWIRSHKSEPITTRFQDFPYRTGK